MCPLDHADSEYKLLVEVDYKGAEFIGNIHLLIQSLNHIHSFIYLYR